MKTGSTQQEILLMTNTSFTQQHWCEKEGLGVNENYILTEKLEEACWNGLLYEMFPGIINKAPDGKHLYLWQIRHNHSSLEMELGEHPDSIDYFFSIDPYLLLAVKNYN